MVFRSAVTPLRNLPPFESRGLLVDVSIFVGGSEAPASKSHSTGLFPAVKIL